MHLPGTTALKFQLYNSLFLQLPFTGIGETGARLTLFSQYCRRGLEEGKSPTQLIQDFLQPEDDISLLFRFIQYAERQVVLFDSVEDASFADNHDLNGKGSVHHWLGRISSAERRQRVLEQLNSYAVRIVLTAHPTQFYPGKVLGIINDLGQAMATGQPAPVLELLLQLGKTAFVNRSRPTPLDEAASLNWYLANVFYEALPQSVYRILHGLQLDVLAFPNPRLMALGFWPGGDRDGNPFVTAEITLEVAHRLRESILGCYYRDVRKLRRRLTFNGVEDILADIERRLYGSRYATEKESYARAEALLDDLTEVRRRLITDHLGLFADQLDLFILKVRMFGFFFASLDIRQESPRHTAVMNTILQRLETQFPTLFQYRQFLSSPQPDQLDFLLSLQTPLDPADYTDEQLLEVYHTFRAIRHIQQENGETGCHRYIISHCGSALDVAQVLVLARMCMGPDPALDIVPLFETVEDLAEAHQTMATLYAHPQYAAHLSRRGGVQTIMLGFSDGTKDGGYLRANWSIYRAKEALSAVSRQYGVQVVFFDGRGGPPGRGGGNNAGYYAAHGAEIDNREIQVTIQGQTVSSTYGTVEAAVFNIEQLFTAGLEHTMTPGIADMRPESKALLDELADAAYDAYLQLKNHPDFVPYLEQMTPLQWYGDSNIASRPTKRNGDRGGLVFKDLRAIPFVGAWAQMKQNIPGYYGFGKALEQLSRAGKGEALQALYRDSRFFRALAENSMQSLIKANFQFTAHLSHHERFGPFWTLLHEEFQRTQAQLLDISGAGELLSGNPVSRESIRIREDIVLPLIVIQQYALQRLQEGVAEESDARILRQLVLRAMFGIINAGRNVA
jgi:phosphoenolpyruvate carboxylase